MGCNVAIYCTLVARNIVMVSCGEPWFTQATASCRSSPVLSQTEPSINGSSQTQALGTSHGLRSFFSAKLYEDVFDVRFHRLGSALERRYALRAVKQRLHQASFREAVISAYNGRCALSGLP